MKATIVDLRYRMKDVLKALDRNEDVHILHHGKTKGVIKPVQGLEGMRVGDHPFFAMRTSESTVEEEMNSLRGERYGDL